MLVLEARYRVGGRVLTNEDGLDMGAQWIHMNKGNVVAKRAEEYGVACTNLIPIKNWVATSLDGVVSRPISDRDEKAAEKARDKCLDHLDQAEAGETWEYSLSDLLKTYKTTMSPVRWRLLLNLLDDVCVDEGGRLHELGSLPMAKVP